MQNQIHMPKGTPSRFLIVMFNRNHSLYTDGNEMNIILGQKSHLMQSVNQQHAATASEWNKIQTITIMMFVNQNQLILPFLSQHLLEICFDDAIGLSSKLN